MSNSGNFWRRAGTNDESPRSLQPNSDGNRRLRRIADGRGLCCDKRSSCVGSGCPFASRTSGGSISRQDGAAGELGVFSLSDRADVEFDSSPEWPANRRTALRAEVESQIRSQIGGLWQLKAFEAPAELHWNSAADIARVTAESLPPAALTSDKAILLGIRPLFERAIMNFMPENTTLRTQTWA